MLFLYLKTLHWILLKEADIEALPVPMVCVRLHHIKEATLMTEAATHRFTS